MNSAYYKYPIALVLALIAFALTSCDGGQQTADQRLNSQQEAVQGRSVSALGMPAITNFREKRLLKDIYELRDQASLVTYTYIVAENTGKLVYLGQSIGYGIPYATQYTSPMRVARYAETEERGNVTLPQADPNGLFSPASAEGTWVLLKDPNSDDVKPIYIEPRIIVSPFKLPAALLAQ